MNPKLWGSASNDDPTQPGAHVFTVHIRGSLGQEAEFVIPSPVLALDLALRAARAGFFWRAQTHGDGPMPLSIDTLQAYAESHAATEPAEAELLREVLMSHVAGDRATLN
jgi:hypothetical protein